MGGLIISLRNAYTSWINLSVGRPGLPNVESKLKVGDAILFETPDEGVFEVRLLNILISQNKATLLVTHVSPTPGLTAAFVGSDPGNAPFTSEEKSKIIECLADVKEKLLESNLFTNEQADLVSRKLDEMTDASDRMGKKDFMNWVIGTLTSLTVTASLSPEARKIMFTSIGESLSWLFRNALQLLP